MSTKSAKKYIDVAQVTPHGGGVLSVANVIEFSAGDHAGLGAEYQTDACAEGGIWDEFCYAVDQNLCQGAAPTPPVGGYKQLDEQPDLVEGEPFAVYAGVECSSPGETADEDRARTRLGYVESRQVDQHVWVEASTGSSALTGGSLLQAIAEAEDVAAQEYGGVATLLVPRSLVTCGYASDLFVWDPLEGVHKTHQGTLVANVAVSAEEIRLTGRITLMRGPVLTASAPETNRPDGSCDPRRALAERIYVPLIECMKYAGPATCGAPVAP
jgi:hypothetical protein